MGLHFLFRSLFPPTPPRDSGLCWEELSPERWPWWDKAIARSLSSIFWKLVLEPMGILGSDPTQEGSQGSKNLYTLSQLSSRASLSPDAQ